MRFGTSTATVRCAMVSCVRNDLSGIGELRQEVRRHEAADFDLAQAARCQSR
jgi:hypothetical protein